MWLLIYSPKKLTWILTAVCFIAVFHVWYMSLTVGDGPFISQTKRFFIVKSKIPKIHILLWNEIKDLKHSQCDVYRDCIFKTKNGTIFEFIEYDFHAVVFNEDVLNTAYRPYDSWNRQLMIFWSLKPSYRDPACKTYNDNFFNWTFTYRLDSTLVWKPFYVQDKSSNEIIAPNMSVIWKTNKDHVKPEVQEMLKKKTKDLAWIVTDCESNNLPESYMLELMGNINRLGLKLDVFSNCSEIRSIHHYGSESNIKNEIVEKYHFLFVFEDYNATDYVSDTILLAYKNYAVPVVYGAANYSRFLPPGSYLNTKEMDSYSLANIMKQAVDDPAFYEGFFNWTNLYEINSYPPEFNPLCELCEALIKQKIEPSRKTIANFNQWWYTPEDCIDTNQISEW